VYHLDVDKWLSNFRVAESLVKYNRGIASVAVHQIETSFEREQLRITDEHLADALALHVLGNCYLPHFDGSVIVRSQDQASDDVVLMFYHEMVIRFILCYFRIGEAQAERLPKYLVTHCESSPVLHGVVRDYKSGQFVYNGHDGVGNSMHQGMKAKDF